VDASLFWTIVGSVAGVTGVIVAIITGVFQLRLPNRVRTAGATTTAVHGVSPSVSAKRAYRSTETALRPPTGRLPARVRGREELLSQLRTMARSPDGRAHLLGGLGGTGKTTIALLLAADLQEQAHPVWWVYARDTLTVTHGFLGLAREVGAQPNEMEEALAGHRDVAGLVWRYLEERPGWVLIFDNADDPQVLTVGDYPVSDGVGWIRPTTAGLVLITSRLADQEAWGRHVQIHSVEWLADIDGASVLLDLAPSAGTIEEATSLSARLGGLPLALHHAGSYLASPFSSVRTFPLYE
jgi:hypothetical protein